MDDSILSELQYCDADGNQVYYTILEEGAIEGSDVEGIGTLETENQELLGDNVFYVAIENDQYTEEQGDDEGKPTFEECSPIFEQIMFADGTQAYVTNGQDNDQEEDNNLEQISTIIKQEQNIVLEDIVDMNKDEGSLNSEDEDNPGQEQDLETKYAQGASDDVFDQSNYEQVCLADGSVAMIEVSLYKSLLDQNKRKTTPPKVLTKAYDCPHENCNKSYTTMHHLRVHIRNHTGNRPYRCEVEGCNKAFSTGYSLKAHSRTHTGEKPYGCLTCLKCFKTSGDLQKHVRIHTGEKPFLCPIEGCGRSFTTSNVRKVHVRSHTGERPYVCTNEGCDRAFASATNFKNHMRIHSGEKPYACTVEGCGKRFTEYSSLYKHHLVHTNYKPCKCAYCGRTFRQQSTLLAHKRSAHNIFITDSGGEIMLNLADTASEILVDVSGQQEAEELQTQIVFVAQ